MEGYCTMTVKVSREDIMEFLSQFYEEGEINESNIDRMATEALEGILSDHFSDYWVIDKDSIVIGNL